MTSYFLPVTFRRAAFLDGKRGNSASRCGPRAVLSAVPIRLLSWRPTAAGFGRSAASGPSSRRHLAA
jgi:hypothetical protein